jgi:2-C-methyl-D-erythritol 4-phosphate cytidylyltransferase
MNKAAILVAGGKGNRMGGPVSKQYLPIGGRPVLMHTLEKFHEADSEFFLILVYSFVLDMFLYISPRTRY